MFSASSSRADDERQVGSWLLGILIQGAREGRELSIQQAAGRAGMTADEWEALEQGQIPRTEEELAAVIEALEVPRDGILPLAFFFQSTQGKDRWRALDIVARCTHNRITSLREGGEDRSNPLKDRSE